MKTHLKTTWVAGMAALALLFGLSLAGCAGADDDGDTANNTVSPLAGYWYSSPEGALSGEAFELMYQFKSNGSVKIYENFGEQELSYTTANGTITINIYGAVQGTAKYAFAGETVLIISNAGKSWLTNGQYHKGDAPKGIEGEDEEEEDEDTKELEAQDFVDAAPITGKPLAQALQDIKNDTRPKVRYTITLDADESSGLETLGYSGRTVEITLRGTSPETTIALSEEGSLFRIKKNVTLTLENITLKGIANKTSNNGGLVYVESRGTLIMNKGSSIKDNYGGYGGGVFVGGAFTMNNGTISGNKGIGGGVFVDKTGTFTMENGTISGNTGVIYGGGVHTEGNFILNNGEISGNSISFNGGGGGGVAVYDSGTFTMSGGEIKNNEAQSVPDAYCNGGGVKMNSGTFTMNGGTISGNKASFSSTGGPGDGGNGGGVASSGSFTMYGGTIKDNEAYFRGGGVYASGSFTMYSGEISGNTASNGGGVHGQPGAEFTMRGGLIQSNTSNGVYGGNSGGNGGGVYVERGLFTLKAGTIQNNTSSGSGSGVFVNHKDKGINFKMDGGVIHGNTGRYGVLVSYAGFTMSGGTISGNAGGVYVDLQADFTMSGGEIKNNTVNGKGGGVFVTGTYQTVFPGGTFTKTADGGVIYGSNESNTALQNKASAAGSGHAVYWDGDTKKYRDTTVAAAAALSTSGGAGWSP